MIQVCCSGLPLTEALVWASASKWSTLSELRGVLWWRRPCSCCDMSVCWCDAPTLQLSALIHSQSAQPHQLTTTTPSTSLTFSCLEFYTLQHKRLWTVDWELCRDTEKKVMERGAGTGKDKGWMDVQVEDTGQHANAHTVRWDRLTVRQQH